MDNGIYATSAENAKPPQAQQEAGFCCGQTATATEMRDCERPMTTAEYRMYQLSQRAVTAQTDSAKLNRVLEILHRRPEFHEFLEVLNSGLV